MENIDFFPRFLGHCPMVKADTVVNMVQMFEINFKTFDHPSLYYS